jgi:hypothetical protein
MKNIFLIMIALVTFTGAVNARRKDDPKTSSGVSVLKSGAILKLFYKATGKSNVKVTIYDDRGAQVFTETIKHVSDFLRPYNFSALRKGDYSIELIDDSGKTVKTFSYNEESEKKDDKQIYLRAYPKDKSKYILSVNSKQKDVLSIKIYNQAHEIVYKSTEQISGDFSKIYNPAKNVSNLTFEITDQAGHTTTLK